MSSIAFTVLGRPIPAGSKRAFQHRSTGKVVVMADNPKQRSWQDSVRYAALVALDVAGVGLLDGPLRLKLVFYLQRPAGHYGTGRNAGQLRAGAPRYPAVKPDVSKLARAVEDGLTGIVITDDARVVSLRAFKRYGTPERVDVHIGEMA